MNSSINNPNAVGNDAVVDVDVCCQRFMPASVMSKLNKLNLRNGLFKVLGEFSLRENLYYGSIFFCMTLIVIVCFVVINNRSGNVLGEDGLGIGSASKIFDDGKINLLCICICICISIIFFFDKNRWAQKTRINLVIFLYDSKVI